MLQTMMKNAINREQTDLTEQITIEPIEQVEPAQYSPAVMEYFTYYNLDGEWCRAEHFFGSFKSGGFTLAGHLYRPAEYTATVILLHGYLNHTGQFKNLIRYLLENGFAVAAYDLPGHGFSTGERAAIEGAVVWGGWRSFRPGTADHLPAREWAQLKTPEVVPTAGHVRLVVQFNSDYAGFGAGHFDVFRVEQYTDGGTNPNPNPTPTPGDYKVNLVATIGGLEIPITGTVRLIEE